ncbi:MAG: formate dehydrogenase accessory protein FdhE [Nitriliruptorales bacterium]|nr:formate dehydrogenase accessory protein FdhE [Nitriliruptorales bacterium]
MRKPRGGPGEFGRRLARAQRVASTPGAREPLAVLCAVLGHQGVRASDPTVTAAAALTTAAAEQRRAANRFPLLDLPAAVDQIAAEVPRAADALLAPGGPTVPEPLASAGQQLAGAPDAELQAQTERWLEDPTWVEPRSAFWIGVAAGPILELGAAVATVPPRNEWIGAACPVCGGTAQVSVIAEETGEFMAGSPRSLVCGRCATWWAFARATCVACGEAQPQRLGSYVAEGMPWARIDACNTCHGYVKTFDLRQDGAVDLVPLVEDTATVALDLWASDQGFHRPVRSLAGV